MVYHTGALLIMAYLQGANQLHFVDAPRYLGPSRREAINKFKASRLHGCVKFTELALVILGLFAVIFRSVLNRFRPDDTSDHFILVC